MYKLHSGSFIFTFTVACKCFKPPLISLYYAKKTGNKCWDGTCANINENTVQSWYNSYEPESQYLLWAPSWRTFQSFSLDFVQFSVKMIPLLQWRWGPSSGEDSPLHETCWHRFSVRFLLHLLYVSLFSLFSFFKNGFLTATWWSFCKQI